MELRAVDHKQLLSWRENFKKQLGCPVIPDHHEALYQLGQGYLIEEMGRTLGYVIINEDNALLLEPPVISELFFNVQPSRYTRKLILEIIESYRPASIISRTDEKLVFPILMDMHMPNQVVTALYDLNQKPHWRADQLLQIKVNQMDEAEDLLPYYSLVGPEYGGLPDQLALTKSLALWRHYRLIRNGEILGVCYLVPQGGPYVSIMTIIKEGVRGQGYGKYLTAYAIQEVINRQQTIIAAIDSDQDSTKHLFESLGCRLTGHVVIFKPKS